MGVSPVEAGQTVAERYELEVEAGSGGMGTVWKARDVCDDRLVAVKILHGRGPVEGERFAREATLLGQLAHPGIVRYVDHGRTSDVAFLVMEWLEGEDLAARLAREGLTVGETVTLLGRVADALAAAHARGVVHRDIKPSNLFLCDARIDRPKILDFGLARRVRDVRARPVTRTGTMIGTLDYMAPEQARGERDVDSRADVFSLGCVLFECLTGRTAFGGEHETAVLAKILLDEPPSARAVSEQVPERLDELCTRMLAKDPARRPRDAAAVLAQLGSLGEMPGSGPAPAVTRQPSLTASEQRVVCIVLAGAPPVGGPTGVIPPTVSVEEESERVEKLRAAVAPFGAVLEVLADGAVIATLATEEIATDQAVRAARCALALRELLPDAPMVLATGRGILASGAERPPVGEVIDRGVRALEGSSAGRIRIDEVTAGLLDARFEVDAAGQCLELTRERDSLEVARPLLGRLVPCVGRDREIRWLEDVLAECVQESVARAVLVTAPAGGGKSRLRQELLRRIRERQEPIEVLYARGDSVGAGAPFAMVADAIRRAAGVAGGEPIDLKRRKLAQRLARTVPEAELRRVTELLGELAGIPPGEDSPGLRAARADAVLMGDAMRTAWEDWLIEECAQKPVLLVLEDLHDGDGPTVRFVDAALRNLKDRPLMVLALARPEVAGVFPGLWEERDVQQLRLPPLGRRAAESLVRQVLGDDLVEAEVSRIVDRADGNAFYLEELIRAVASGASGLPDTVLGMVQVRLDALGAPAKRVLRAASVFGDSFRRDGLQTLLGEAGGGAKGARVGEILDDLVAREILVRRGSPQVPGDELVSFRHRILRETAYAMLTDEDRALGHRMAGDFLERVGEPRATVVAEHFVRAGERHRAINWYRRGAEQALEGNDLLASIDLARRGIDCGASGEVLSALLVVQAEAHFWRGELEEAIDRATAATGIAGSGIARGSSGWFGAVGLAIIAGGQLGQYDRVGELGRDAASAPAADDAAESARIVCICRSAVMLILAGRYGAVDALLEHVGTIAPDFSRLGRSAAAWAYSVFAIRAHQMGEPGAALFGSEAALAAFEEARDQRNACLARATLGFGCAELGQYERAESELRRALKTAERMGLHNVVAYAEHNLGYVLGRRGALEEARAIEARAVAFFGKRGDHRFEGGSRTYLSSILCRQGRHEDAEREARRAMELLAVAPSSRAVALAALARALLEQGRIQEALGIAREARGIRDTLGGIDEGESLLDLVLAESLDRAGSAAEARSAIADARRRLLERADSIVDPTLRASFLASVAENARIMSLADAWG